jgi:autotransporter-associated beta strand protein
MTQCPARPFHAAVRLAVISLGLAVAAHPSALAQSFTWAGTTSGTWSDPTKWQGGVAPPAGGSATTALTFAAAGSTAYTATNNLGNPFALERLTFESTSAGLLTIASASGNSLSFGGVNPVILVNGSGGATVSSGLQLNANTTIGGAGTGALTLSGAISQTGGPRGLVITSTAPFATLDTRVVTLSGANTFAGGVTLQAGNLALSGSDAALGTGSLTVNGGSLRVNGNPRTAANPVVLNSNLLYLGGNLTLTGSVTGAGTGLEVRGVGTLSLQGPTTYSGETTVSYSALLQSATGGAGVLRLQGAGGALAGTSAIHLVGGGNLVLDNGTPQSAANGNRLGDTTPIELRSGRVDLLGNGVVAVGETAGPVTASGYSVIAVNSGSARPTTTLTFASLNRSADRGSLQFTGANLGATTGATQAHVFFSSPLTGDLIGGSGAAGTPNVSVLPYAVGDSPSGGTLVTYTAAGGIRPLNETTEFVGSLAGVQAATNNLRLTANDTVSAPATVNALVTGGTVVTLNGGSALTITSGAVLFRSATPTTINAPLAFGAQEAHVDNVLTGLLPDVINSPLTGNGGFTKSGVGLIRLTADNSGLTGPLTINRGSLGFTAADQLPGTGAIAITGASLNSAVNVNGGLQFEGNTAVTLSRDVRIDGLATVVIRAPTAAGKFTLGGAITGPGTLSATDSSFQNGTLLLTRANTYTGGTVIDGARVLVNNTSGSGTGSGAVVVQGTGGTYGILGGRGAVSGPVTLAAVGSVAPGDPATTGGIGTLTFSGATAVHEFQGRGKYSWQVNSVPSGGVAGVNWDFLDSAGRLHLSANVASQFVIDIVATGTVAGFDNSHRYEWTVATFAGGIDAAPDGTFSVNPIGWSGSNSLGGGSFDARIEGNDLVVVFTPVPEPGSALLVGAAAGVAGRLWFRRGRSGRTGGNGSVSQPRCRCTPGPRRRAAGDPVRGTPPSRERPGR